MNSIERIKVFEKSDKICQCPCKETSARNAQQGVAGERLAAPPELLS